MLRPFSTLASRFPTERVSRLSLKLAKRLPPKVVSKLPSPKVARVPGVSRGQRWAMRRLLGPLFDPAFYLSSYPDVARGGMDPLAHFLRWGVSEGRWPNPLFDTRYYLAANPDVAARGENPLFHFIRQGAAEGRNPNPLFDTAFYLQRNPDVAAAGVNPLAHYLSSGAREGRKPNPLFDSAYYLERNPDVAAAGLNPLGHYLASGCREGRKPNPLFDSAYYLERNPDVAAAGVNPLVHYLGAGFREGRDPSPLFSTSFYLMANPDVADAGVNALAHFLERGGLENRKIGPVRLSERIRQAMEAGEYALACDLHALSCAPVAPGEPKTLRVAVQVRGALEELRRRGTVQLGEVGATTTIAAPVVYGANLRPRGVTAALPPEYVGVLEDVGVVGGTKLIVTPDHTLLHDELSQFTYGGDYGVKTLQEVAFLQGKRALLSLKRRASNRIETGILLSSDHDNNYFHWLVECLPKLVFINTRPEFDGIPLLIGKNLHPNLIRALEVVNQSRRPVIRLEDGHLFQVKRLILPSDLSRLMDRYEGSVVPEVDCVYAPGWVRRTAQVLGSIHQKPAEKPWRKLYLSRRNASYRKVRNENDIELMLLEQGFEIVGLEGASLESQVALFRQASIIVGPTGAAFTNLLFCQEGTRGVVLSSDHESSNLYIFSQLAQIMGVRLEYVLGRRLYNLSSFTVHDDYHVDVNLLRDVVADLGKGIVHAAS